MEWVIKEIIVYSMEDGYVDKNNCVVLCLL